MISHQEKKQIGFIKVKGTKAKEWYQQVHPEVVLLLKGDYMIVLAKSSAIMYLTGGHLTLKKEDYDKWISEQPDKFVGNHTWQMLQHNIDVLKESFNEKP